jgi:mono/diheme cytochrome c family protein
MRQHLLSFALVAAVIVFGAVGAVGPATIALGAQSPKSEPLTNPVKADAVSIAAGKKLYDSNCAPCHGESAKGDGKMASQFNPKPADLTDAEWAHGSTDGEIFAVLRDGVKNTGMKGFGSKMTAHQMWDVINYVRSLGPSKKP